MVPFVYRCPVTGYKVQGHAPKDQIAGSDGEFVAVTCTICTRTHLVNLKTETIAGDRGPDRKK